MRMPRRVITAATLAAMTWWGRRKSDPMEMKMIAGPKPVIALITNARNEMAESMRIWNPARGESFCLQVFLFRRFFDLAPRVAQPHRPVEYREFLGRIHGIGAEIPMPQKLKAVPRCRASQTGFGFAACEHFQ